MHDYFIEYDHNRLSCLFGAMKTAVLPGAQEFGKHGDQWHRLYAGMPGDKPTKVNAVELREPLAQYEMLCGLLVPLYAARATEEVLYGRSGVTLQTSREVRSHAAGRLHKSLQALQQFLAIFSRGL